MKNCISQTYCMEKTHPRQLIAKNDCVIGDFSRSFHVNHLRFLNPSGKNGTRKQQSSFPAPF
jgi:hypothetical protein